MDIEPNGERDGEQLLRVAAVMLRLGKGKLL